MQAIQHNPFRILNIPCTASEREIARQISKYEIYAEMGKPLDGDDQTVAFGDFDRTPETIQQAAKQIEQGELRLYHSFLWFSIDNDDDRRAMKHLHANELDAALEIWNPPFETTVTEDYNQFLQLKNRYVVLLGQQGKEMENLAELLMNAGRFFESEHLEKYVLGIAGDNYVFFRDKVSQHFVNELIGHFNPFLDGPEATRQFVSNFNFFSADTIAHVQSKFTGNEVFTIEEAVSTAAEQRKENPAGSHAIGEVLWKKVRPLMKELKTLLGEDDIQYQMTADNVADELLQCSTMQFNEFYKEDRWDAEKDTEISEHSLRLTNYAETIAVGTTVKQRIVKDQEYIHNWIKDQPGRIANHSCYYCGKNSPSEPYTHNIKMHKVTGTEYTFNGRRVSYNQITIPVKRCRQCGQMHEKVIAWQLLGLLVGFIIGYAIGYFLVPDEMIGGLIAGTGVGLLVMNIVGVQFHKKNGIKRKRATKGHPMVAQCKAEGFVSGSSPS